jgi:hypothetical protein
MTLLASDRMGGPWKGCDRSRFTVRPDRHTSRPIGIAPRNEYVEGQRDLGRSPFGRQAEGSAMAVHDRKGEP